MIAAAKLGAAILDDADAAALRAIIRRELLKAQNRMRDAVDGLVGDIGREIIEKHHGRIEPGKKVLDGQNLPAVPQRALGEKPDFRKTVEHDAMRLDPIDRLENLLGRLAEFEIGGVEKALLLF